MSNSLEEMLRESAARHDHLCPRQVLGVRMALAGLEALGIEPPITKQSALVIVETDGCFADGIEIGSGATIGHRTLRVHDLGKIAATFADVKAGRTIRLSPWPDARERARFYAGNENRHYFVQLLGYQVMPAAELFRTEEVVLEPSLADILSRPGVRVRCDACGEEIINERQVVIGGATLCRSCAYGSYYKTLIRSGVAPAGFGSVCLEGLQLRVALEDRVS
jgi:formylmethanofuran dehydrogenase subunit E